MNQLVVDAEVTHTTKNIALTKFKFNYPFIYWVYFKNIGYLRLGFKIKDAYIKYLETDDFSHIENAVPDITLLIGWCWSKLFGEREHDPDVMDPVAYYFIFKLRDKALPIDYGFPSYVRIMIRRHLLRHFYKQEQQKGGDRSIRTFTYRPFPTARDVEHKIFIDDLKVCLLERLEHDTRLDETERKVSKYIAECALKGVKISEHLIDLKFGLNVKKDKEKLRFLVDFTDVTVRNYLYWVRKCIPNIYGDEKNQFVSIFELNDEDEVDFSDEEELKAYYAEMGHL
jgi:hypothetical protein